MTSFWPGCGCCDEPTGCNLFTWDADSELNDFDVDSGTWALDEPPSEPSNTFIACTSVGEIILKGTSLVPDGQLPTSGYAAMVLRGDLPDQEVSLKIYDDLNSIIMKVTLGEDGVDDAGALSIKVDAVEQYATLPQRSDISDGDDLDHSLVLHCSWSGGEFRVELGRTDGRGITAPFKGIGTKFPIDWTPTTLSIIADPLTGTVRIEELIVDRIETAGEVCVLTGNCANRLTDNDNRIPREIGALIGEWNFDDWDANEYAADADYTGNPSAAPPTGTNVKPLGIITTEETRASGYYTQAEIAAGAAMDVGTWYHLSSLFVDGDDIEVRWYARRTVFFPSQFSWRGDLYVGGSLVATGALINGSGIGNLPYGTPGQFYWVWVGDDVVRAGLANSRTTEPPYISVSISPDFHGEFVRCAAGGGATYHYVDSIIATYCDGPPVYGSGP